MSNINGDTYFMLLSKVSAQRSKDPNTKVGATIVNEKNRVIGLGYNGMPNGNDDFPGRREGDAIDTKYAYVIHAELNAVLNAVAKVEKSRLYVSLFPCSNCAKLLVQYGIFELIYEDDKYKHTEDSKISRKILEVSNIKIRKIKQVKMTIK